MKSFLNLLRSMRFAIGILIVVALAASIGSVLEQNQPAVVYVSRYGQFWAGIFAFCGLTDIYHAWWFFTLLAFMATSTALCLAQNTPSMIRDMRSYRENKSLASLRRLEYSREYDLTSAQTLQPGFASYLSTQGYRYKYAHTGGGTLLAARSGSARRLGYLLVHAAMVLTCIGGLVDGNVLLRLQLWAGMLKIETRDLAPSAVPAISRLSADSGSYRASMNVAEGAAAGTALLQMGDGYLLQELPFHIRLKQFRIDHYANGQPKDFSSDIDIIDGTHTQTVTLQVNHPYTYRGVTLFQSGFADGGSKVKLRMLGTGAAAQDIEGTVGEGAALLLDGQPATLEFTELRTTNVFRNDDQPGGGWNSRGLPGARMRDLGPSLAFRLRDQQGQADEWHIFQRPADIGGRRYLLIGRQRTGENGMRYLRLPVDADGSPQSYLRFAQALRDDAQRRQAARAVAANAGDPRLTAAVEETSKHLLDLYASQGYRAVSAQIPKDGDPARAAKIRQLYRQLLDRAATELHCRGQSRHSDTSSCPNAGPDPGVGVLMEAYDDALAMQLPALFQFDGYTLRNATVLQVTHAPGAALVYLGAAMLAAGVMAMYFVRERRLWLHAAGGKLLLAFTANRNNPGLQAEFDRHASAIARLAGVTTR